MASSDEFDPAEADRIADILLGDALCGSDPALRDSRAGRMIYTTIRKRRMPDLDLLETDLDVP